MSLRSLTVWWWASDAPASPSCSPPASPFKYDYLPLEDATQQLGFGQNKNNKGQRNAKWGGFHDNQKHHQQRNAATAQLKGVKVQRSRKRSLCPVSLAETVYRIHKYAQFVTCGIPSLSVHRISLWHVDVYFLTFESFLHFCQQGASLHIVSAQHSTIVTREKPCVYGTIITRINIKERKMK